jgi:hypothetical protein
MNATKSDLDRTTISIHAAVASPRAAARNGVSNGCA